MKVTNFTTSQFKQTQDPKQNMKSTVMATGTGIVVHDKNEVRGVIQKNDPSDPAVSKKILDSLDLGFIDFSQEERDVIAKIMMDKARKLKDS
jgi:hypothetical protein